MQGEGTPSSPRLESELTQEVRQAGRVEEARQLALLFACDAARPLTIPGLLNAFFETVFKSISDF